MTNHLGLLSVVKFLRTTLSNLYIAKDAMLKTMLDKFNLVELQNHPANMKYDQLAICELFTTEEQFKLLADRLQVNIACSEVNNEWENSFIDMARL